MTTLSVVLSVLVAAFLAAALTVALLMLVYRRVLRGRLSDELLRVSGPSIVGALLPQQVMTTFLTNIYGAREANLDVVAGVLGGEGVEPHGADLTISTYTTVDFELSAVDHQTYELVSTVTYSFKENVDDHRFVIFATCDPLLRDSITLACRLPLFESWFVADHSLFEQSVDAILSSVKIGIRYTDFNGRHHDVAPSKMQISEVGYRDWADFLTFFRGPVGTMPRQNPMQYIGTLRIFECDLSELTDVDHAVGSVENMSLQSTSLGRIDDNFCFWQAPYPCYVDRIRFDATALVANDSSCLFQVVPFTFRSTIATGTWIPAEQLKDLTVRSWLLPGHGVALLWKSATNRHTTDESVPDDVFSFSVPRQVNAWLAEPEGQWWDGKPMEVLLDIGPRRSTVVKPRHFVESLPAIDDDGQWLYVLLLTDNGSVEPVGAPLWLPARGPTAVLRFEVTPTRPGPLVLCFRVFLQRGSLLLQELTTTVTVASQPTETRLERQ
jgi:hypothetical protein